VAEVPVYVYQLRRYRREGGIFPEMSHGLPVLRFAGLEHGVGQFCGLV
jgi:hypothetical protein